MDKSREQRPLALALLVSLLLHALLLSLTFGVNDFGPPGLAFPWRERRIVVPDLHVVLVPGHATREKSLVVSDAETPREVAIEPRPAARSLSTRPEAPALESPAPAPTSASVLEQTAQADPTLTAVVPDASSAAAAPAQQHTRVEASERPRPVQISEPAAMEVERSDSSSSWVVHADRFASAPVVTAAASAPRAETAPSALPDSGLAAQEGQREEAVRRETARVEGLLRLEVERQTAERLEVQRQELMRQETARQDAEREEAARREGAQQEVARRLAAEQEAQRQEAQRQDVARQEAARVELARLTAERQETARQAAETERQERARAAAAQLEAERQETERATAARLEAKQQETAREEAARREAARLALEREEIARREADKREDTARRAAAELEAQRQETARAEAAPPTPIAKEAPRVEPERDEEARREARLRAIGRQLDEEAARREAASKAAPLANTLPYSLSSARRVRLWGRAHANAELVEYAEAFARKIQLNTLSETVRELAKRPHKPSMVTVALRSDGSVESVTVVASSGVAEVDEAIRRIVDSHRPYPAFPRALAREFDVVEIRRTWVFNSAVWLY